MKKLIITITTDASIMTVNKMQNNLLNELLTGDFTIEEYTIQEVPVKYSEGVKWKLKN